MASPLLIPAVWVLTQNTLLCEWSRPAQTLCDPGESIPMKFLKGRPLSILENEDRERIRDANPIEQVVGKYVDLVQRGRVFKGLCPFHDDSNPSMDVDPDRGTFKCWACNEGGDVFAFIQKRYNLDFLESMEHLAQEAGIEFRRRPVDPEVAAQRDKDLEMLEWVTEWFIRQLESPSGKDARENLKKRGFRTDMIRKFRISSPNRKQNTWAISMCIKCHFKIICFNQPFHSLRFRL